MSLEKPKPFNIVPPPSESKVNDDVLRRAYKDLIYRVCLIYLNNAIKSYKASLIQELIKGDAEDLAIILKELK